MMEEDLTAFFDAEGFGAPCAANGHLFVAILDMPSQTDTFEVMDVVSADRMLMAASADIALANLQPGGSVTVDGQLFPIQNRPFLRSGCGRITRMKLGKPT